MTRKDYRMIAMACKQRIEWEPDSVRRKGVEDLTIVLANAFAAYSNFNRRKFLDACGLENAQ